jgi:quinol monooxygenase YgiN
MNGIIAVVAYRPKDGKNEQLLELVRNRVPTLRDEGLATDRAPVIMRSRDGTIVEVSEWKSREAIDAAHKNPSIWRCGKNSLPFVIVCHLTLCPKLPICSQGSRRSKIDTVRFLPSFWNQTNSMTLG